MALAICRFLRHAISYQCGVSIRCHRLHVDVFPQLASEKTGMLEDGTVIILKQSTADGARAPADRIAALRDHGLVLALSARGFGTDSSGCAESVIIASSSRGSLTEILAASVSRGRATAFDALSQVSMSTDQSERPAIFMPSPQMPYEDIGCRDRDIPSSFRQYCACSLGQLRQLQ
jgi:hypothetical protein